MKESKDQPSPSAIVDDLQLKIKPERRAAKIANTKIAESTKILASTKIIATSSLPPPPKPRAKPSPKTPKPIPKAAVKATALTRSVVKLSVKPGTSKTNIMFQPKTPDVVTKTVMVKKTAPTSLLSPTTRVISVPASKAMASAKITSTLQGKQVTFVTKPLLKPGIGGIPSKLPFLVFNQTSGQVQSYIPLTSGALPPNTLISFAAPKRPVATTQPKLLVLPTPKPTLSKAIRNETGLVMECEDDELSGAQRISCKKAESEYVDMLRKLTKWKKDLSVQVITIGADDPLPPVPVIPDVIDASKLNLGENPFVANPVPMETSISQDGKELMPKITEIQSGVLRKDDKGSVSVVPATGNIKDYGRKTNAVKTSISSVEPTETVSINKISDLDQHPDLFLKCLPQKLLPHTVVASKKKELDDIFKSLLNSGKLAVEKWMLEKGLFGATRYCLFHSHIQMKLTYMSCLNDEVGKSGYKWWCPSCAVMVSANQGSFFSRWKMSHNDILRVIYHWACNNDIKTVISEFENVNFVCSVYKSLRAICNAQTIHWRIGGPNHSVEFAELRIGNCMDSESVIMYCAYDRATRLVVLGASQRTSIRNSLSFVFKTFIAKDTTIVGDRVIQPHIPSNCQLTFISSSPFTNAANLNAMAYLKDQVDNVLKGYYHRLTLASIQSILDELAWREKFGQNPKDAFSHIINHIKQAYSCSVVSTKGSNSLPIAMASGLKVVDTSKLQAEQSVSKSPDELLGNHAQMPVPNDEDESKEKPEQHEENDAMGTEDDDDDGMLLVTADCILEEPPENEEPLIIDSDNDTIIISSVNKNSAKNKPVVEPFRISSSNDKKDSLSITKKLPLESLYYSSLPGKLIKQTTLHHKFKFKCHLCKKLLDDNIKTMKHIYFHLDNVNPAVSKECKICCKDFITAQALQTHVEKVHNETSNETVCRICFKEYPKRHVLEKHMKYHKIHEMPYECKLCGFRSSFYRDVINHFPKFHANTDKLQCRYCLQVFAIKFSHSMPEGITFQFYKHLNQHKLKQNKYKRYCTVCCLSFATPDELHQHKTSDHVSFFNRANVTQSTSEDKPNAIAFVNSTEENSACQSSSVDDAQEISIQVDPSSLKCIECQTPLYRFNHFLQKMNCSMCKLVTSCSRAFADHAIKFHSVPPRVRSKPFHSLSHRLHCLCNYSTSYGDTMARHLVSKCTYKWCYIDAEEAKNRGSRKSHVDQ